MDDREWNEDFNKSNEDCKRIKTEADKKMIRKYSENVIENENGKWIVTLDTEDYGSRNVIYFPESGKWNSEKGKANGRGAVKMLNYFKPKKREKNGNIL